MIQKREITDDELLFVMLSCNWADPDVRKKFAAQGLYLNVLKEDEDWSVAFAAYGFLASEESLKTQYKKHPNPTRNIR